jgi:type I restriction enzyme M protein
LPISNERNTEELVRARFRELGYYDDEHCWIDEQRSRNDEVSKLLKVAGKGGKGGHGAPEFIVFTDESPDVVIVVECKAKASAHESPDRSRPQDFAVDGVLWYSRFLSKAFNVVGVAVSGQSQDTWRISNFLWPKLAQEPRDLLNHAGMVIDEMVPLADYIAAAEFDPEVQQQRTADLMAFSRELHIFMRDHAKLSESEKPLLVSGTLIALRNRPFALGYQHYSADELQAEWLRVIQSEMKRAAIPVPKTLNMTQPYSAIAVHPELGKSSGQFPRGVLHELIKMLADRVMPFISIYHDFDVVGQFYGEFLKYTGGDKKSLGIVLTPRHITDLFAHIAHVTKNDKVIDPCVGTGGFLISAMRRMAETANTEGEIRRIKGHGLIGIEQQPQMYALAASNMILRGDGRANLHQGSCFDSAMIRAAKEYKANIGMINPPYAQGDADLHELRFVDNMLDLLQAGGTGVAIVPVSCATAPSVHKGTLLNKHTLEAVMSMPNELFYPVGIVTCIMVFTAKRPHTQTGRKTWFGYWRDDGFVKTKHLGRIDPDGRWPAIRDSWVEAYRNRQVQAGRSVMAQVTAADEWVAEAYLETDYSTITETDFQHVVRDYVLHQVINSVRGQEGEDGDAA